MPYRKKYTGPWWGECVNCDWRGPDRDNVDLARIDQSHHADSRQHQLAIAARDRGDTATILKRQG